MPFALPFTFWLWPVETKVSANKSDSNTGQRGFGKTPGDDRRATRVVDVNESTGSIVGGESALELLLWDILDRTFNFAVKSKSAFDAKLACFRAQFCAHATAAGVVALN